jgi:protein-tyrosine-phosphatase
MSVVDILVVCTANQSRSPMAEAMIRRELELRGVDAHVDSAGTKAAFGIPATREAIAVMDADGFDITQHASRPVEATDLDRADIILTMTRAQLRELAIRSPGAFPRLFTMKELARLARAGGPRRHQDVGGWIGHVAAGRRTTDLLGDDPLDDVDDPVGCSLEVYAAVARELTRATADVVDACWPRALNGT